MFTQTGADLAKEHFLRGLASTHQPRAHLCAAPSDPHLQRLRLRIDALKDAAKVGTLLRREHGLLGRTQ